MNKVREVVETGVPSELSYGFVCGYCSGLALKKLGRAAATTLGFGFAALQVLSYKGYVEVDHALMKKKMEDMMDLNKDGKVDGADLDEVKNKAMDVLSYNLPAGSGFGVGFVGGFRSG